MKKIQESDELVFGFWIGEEIGKGSFGLISLMEPVEVENPNCINILKQGDFRHRIISKCIVTQKVKEEKDVIPEILIKNVESKHLIRPLG